MKKAFDIKNNRWKVLNSCLRSVCFLVAFERGGSNYEFFSKEDKTWKRD